MTRWSKLSVAQLSTLSTNFTQEDRVNKPKRGRAPRCIILAPTRELANQVAKEFYTVCPSLKVRGGGRAC